MVKMHREPGTLRTLKIPYRAAPAAAGVGHVSIRVVESGDPRSYPQAFPRERASPGRCWPRARTFAGRIVEEVYTRPELLERMRRWKQVRPSRKEPDRDRWLGRRQSNEVSYPGARSEDTNSCSVAFGSDLAATSSIASARLYDSAHCIQAAIAELRVKTGTQDREAMRGTVASRTVPPLIGVVILTLPPRARSRYRMEVRGSPPRFF